MRLGRGHVDKHKTLAVAAEIRLKKVGQLGVAVWNVLLLGGQGGYDWSYNALTKLPISVKKNQ